MKIGLIHYSSPPVAGGVERVIEEHAKLFADHGHEVTVFCSRGECFDSRVAVVNLSDDEAKLRELLARQSLVFIHNVMTMPFDLKLTEALWRLADELCNVCFVAWIHDMAVCSDDYPSAPELLGRIHPRMRYVAVSDLRRRQFLKLNPDAGERCGVVPNGCDPARVLGLTPEIAELAKKHALLNGGILLFHPTRLLRRKNVEFSLAVTAAIKGAGERVKLLITGAEDGHNPLSVAYEKELRGIQEQLGLRDDVVFIRDHMSISDMDLASLYRMSGALLFPSQSEGFGLPIIEAALHGLSVFCQDIEPQNSLLKENVFYFPPDATPGQVASAILKQLLSSPSFRERKHVLERYAWDTIWREHLSALLSAVE